MSDPETKLAGASVWEAEMFRLLTTHVDTEADIIEKYRQFAAQAPSEAVRYLVQMILDDEARHHRVMFEMANALRSEALLEDASPRVPPLGVGAADGELRAQTHTFIEIERHDLAEVRALIRRLRSGSENDLWVLLLKLMRDDTRRHIRILP